MGEWRDRPDVWYVLPDGSNLAEVVFAARDRIITDGLPWLDRLSDLREALQAFIKGEDTQLGMGIIGEFSGGTIGSPTASRPSRPCPKP